MRCRSNLRQIGTAYRVYALQQQNAVPPSPAELIVEADLPGELFVCATSNATPIASTQPNDIRAAFADPTAAHYSYAFVSSVPRDMKQWTPQHVVAFEPLANHGNGMNVLFGDGHVEWLTSNCRDGPADVLLRDFRAGVVPLVVK